MNFTYFYCSKSLIAEPLELNHRTLVKKHCYSINKRKHICRNVSGFLIFIRIFFTRVNIMCLPRLAIFSMFGPCFRFFHDVLRRVEARLVCSAFEKKYIYLLLEIPKKCCLYFWTLHFYLAKLLTSQYCVVSS